MLVLPTSTASVCTRQSRPRSGCFPCLNPKLMLVDLFATIPLWLLRLEEGLARLGARRALPPRARIRAVLLLIGSKRRVRSQVLALLVLSQGSTRALGSVRSGSGPILRVQGALRPRLQAASGHDLTLDMGGMHRRNQWHAPMRRLVVVQ